MIINNITLNNFRLYKGVNKIQFKKKEGKNIFLISGENGFGKTTFLQSLLWCLYGKMLGDIEEQVKKEISSNGYNSFLQNNLNRDCIDAISSYSKLDFENIRKKGYYADYKEIQNISRYSVSIEFEDVQIPSIKCRSLKVERTYDYILDKESAIVYIDNAVNELAIGIGADVFINDFILNKDIARFFFFDSEKIVDIADTNTISERRKLCSAYNEVLGVKKYEDLKNNLENLRIKFRRKSNDINLREQLNEMLNKRDGYKKKISSIEHEISLRNKNLEQNQQINEELQIKLLKEGNGMSIEELNRQELLIKACVDKNIEYKKQLKLFLEYAPFAIVGHQLVKAKELINHDYQVMKSRNNAENQNVLINNISNDILELVSKLNMPKDISESLKFSTTNILKKYCTQESQEDSFIDVTKEFYNEFMSIFQNITTTYKSEFARLTDDYKKNKQIWERASRRVSNMKNNESDEVIKEYRKKKTSIEKIIQNEVFKLRELHEQYGIASQCLANIDKEINTLSKKVSLNDSDVKKDRVADQLINELSQFLKSLRLEKKYSLEYRIQSILNTLMHKEDFVGKVLVVTENEDELDIQLLTKAGQIIQKNSLSKGEQQLYATSILKALVEESGVKFPVFIDSPLQKFDKSHANKIITEFYPCISNQVILFPLLHKELSNSEFKLMKNMVNSTFLIKNEKSHSYFQEIEVNKFMED